jgi:protoheme IX farnesyltransferase
VSITERAVLSRRGRVRATLFDYMALTKPRTIHLVVGVIPGVLLADRGVVAPLLIVNTLTGAIFMAAGGGVAGFTDRAECPAGPGGSL